MSPTAWNWRLHSPTRRRSMGIYDVDSMSMDDEEGGHEIAESDAVSTPGGSR